MLPFEIDLKPGEPVYRQVTYAVRRAFVSGQLRPGDPFPSVRELSRELRINPNTVQKIVSSLKSEGLLMTIPGVGTRIGDPPSSAPIERDALLDSELEKTVVAAKRAGLRLEQVQESLADHWDRLSGEESGRQVEEGVAKGVKR